MGWKIMVGHALTQKFRTVVKLRSASKLRTVARHVRLAVVALFAAALLASCGGGSVSKGTPPPQGKPLESGRALQGGGTVPAGQTPKVALLLPMSGPFEKIGTAMRQAAELALFEIAGKGFEMTPIDTGGTPEGARRAAQQARAAGAHLILGPLLSGSVQAVKEELANDDINIIAFSTDAGVAGGKVYLMGFLVQPQIERIVDYASKQGLKRIAVVAPEGAYGNAVVAAFKLAIEKHQVSDAGTLLYPVETADMTKVFRAFTNYDLRAAKLQRAIAKTKGRTDAASRRARARAKRDIKVDVPQWDAVIIADGGARLLLAASMLAFYDVNPDKVQYLGTGQWDDPTVGREPNLKGGWFAAPPPEARAKFEAKFKAQFKSDPPRIATLAYDAVALAAVLARSEGGANFGPEAIASANGFIGLDGIFRFLPGGLSQRGLAVLEVAEDEVRMIGNAPKTFEVATETE
ncbi:MAG TPA: penicillin-binding protein activator [Alphaproteobacteria bacterium]|nr:penicillin-binding protein activator [Alphaproteobacteria bacterium]